MYVCCHLRFLITIINDYRLLSLNIFIIYHSGLLFCIIQFQISICYHQLKFVFTSIFTFVIIKYLYLLLLRIYVCYHSKKLLVIIQDNRLLLLRISVCYHSIFVFIIIKESFRYSNCYH